LDAVVEADRAHRTQVKGGDGATDIVLDDAPQPLVGDADEARCGQHRHLAHQDHRRLLEQQREPATRPRPRHRDPPDPVLRTFNPRHPGRDEAVVLEEVQVLPSEALEVVRLAGPLAFRAREQRAPLRDHLQLQLIGSLLDIQPLAGKLPWLAQAKPERKHILCFHRPASHAPTLVACGARTPHSTAGQFHLKRRGTLLSWLRSSPESNVDSI